MANLERKIYTPKPRKRFLEVDLWRTCFGDISVEAIYDIYSQKFNVKKGNMKRYSFHNCLNALRKLENPDYVLPDYGK